VNALPVLVTVLNSDIDDNLYEILMGWQSRPQNQQNYQIVIYVLSDFWMLRFRILYFGVTTNQPFPALSYAVGFPAEIG